MDATRGFLRLGLPAVALCAVVTGLFAGPSEAEAKKGWQIGVVTTLFRDKPAQLVQLAVNPFKRYMSIYAGVSGDVTYADDSETLAQQLIDKKVHFGVFNGFEFAWAQEKHPELRPLVIAVKKPREQRAVLVVRKGESAESIADLKGKTLAIAKGTREHCRLFVERTCQACQGVDNWQAHFGKVEAPVSPGAALDNLVKGRVDAAIVENATLDAYKLCEPGSFGKIKELHRSEPFPQTVLAYVEGSVDQQTIDSIRKNLVNANQCADGRSLLALWALEKFEAADAEYDAHLGRIAKLYPAPGKE